MINVIPVLRDILISKPYCLTTMDGTNVKEEMLLKAGSVITEGYNDKVFSIKQYISHSHSSLTGQAGYPTGISVIPFMYCKNAKRLIEQTNEILSDYKKITIHHTVIYSTLYSDVATVGNCRYEAYKIGSQIIIPQFKGESHIETPLLKLDMLEIDKPFGHVSGNRIFSRIFTTDYINDQQKEELKLNFLRIAGNLQISIEKIITSIQDQPIVLELQDVV